MYSSLYKCFNYLIMTLEGPKHVIFNTQITGDMLHSLLV